MLGACAYCTKMGEQGVDLKKCSKCKMTVYCSKECQKKDWSFHKTRCSSLANRFSNENITKCFTSNAYLWHLIEMACILEFGLDKKPPVLNRPLIAKCTVELVPSWIPPTGGPYQVLLPTELAKATHTIYQVSAFEPIANPEVEEKRMALWKKSKDTNPDFCAGVTIVLLDFEIRGDPERVVVSVPISDTMIGIVKEGAGFTHSVGSDVRRKPYSVPSCFSVLNHHIRSDEDNELGLRLPISVEFRPILRVD